MIQHKYEATEIRGVPRSQRGAITCFVGRSEGDETKQQLTVTMKSASPA